MDRCEFVEKIIIGEQKSLDLAPKPQRILRDHSLEIFNIMQ
ncbi:SLEI domain protein, PF07620 family [Leptospira interrogans serovar Bataviae str. HAI135]|nr:SLEI domain protein, PF07620 family [Leptospira interrogans serovar Bataviae str. HAI135]